MKKWIVLLLASLVLVAMAVLGYQEYFTPEDGYTYVTITDGSQVTILIGKERGATALSEHEALVQAVVEWESNHPCYSLNNSRLEANHTITFTIIPEDC